MNRLLGLRLFREKDGRARVIVAERTPWGVRKRLVIKASSEKIRDLVKDGVFRRGPVTVQEEPAES